MRRGILTAFVTGRTARRRAVALLVVAAGAFGGGALISGASDADAPAPDVFARIGSPLNVPPIPAGFVGLSTEYNWAAQLAGPPSHQDTVLERLVRQLAPGQSPVIRIGGDSSDHTWWPAPGLRYPDPTAFPLTPRWLSSVAAFARAIHARLILGLNLESGNRRLIDAEARELVKGIGRRLIQSLELGNEPNLYDVIGWYATADGTIVHGRALGYGPPQYLRDVQRFRRGLPPLPLAGPALGEPPWMGRVLQPLLRQTPNLRDVTFHRYPLNRCFTRPGSPKYPTIPNLLSITASRGLAASVAPFARIARARHDAFRVDELNSVACRGKPGISDTFASALWSIDALFAMAQQGVTGVNIHTFPSAAYRLFSLADTNGRWSASVRPEYYGLLLFTRAAPAGSRLLRVAVRGTNSVRAWATRGPQAAGPIRIALINDDPTGAHTVQIDVGGAIGAAILERLAAPGVSARTGVTLAGQRFGAFTTTGRLTGSRLELSVRRAGGGYRVTLPPASAALLTAPVRR